MYDDIANQGTSDFDIFIDFIYGLPHLYVSLSFILFAVSCYATAVSLHSIQQDIHRYQSIKLSTLMAKNLLSKWKRCHGLIHEAMKATEHCFGPTLFISITYVLIRFIDLVLRILPNGFSLELSNRTARQFSIFAQLIGWLALSCVPIDHLRFKVNYFFILFGLVTKLLLDGTIAG